MIILRTIKVKINLKNFQELTKIRKEIEILLMMNRMLFVNKLLICAAAVTKNKMKLVKNLCKISKYSLSRKTNFYSKILICNFK